MLSILIPTKDYDCRNLVQTLHKQCDMLQYPYEIIVAEDGSSPRGAALNAPLEQLPHCRIIRSKENVGRAKIRNRLAREARYRYLLFMDSDAVVEEERFIDNYIEALADSAVVCGGLYHAAKQPDDTCSLRYRYEKKADKERSAKTRSKTPYNKFTTFNFAIERRLFLSIQFNESITRYGYEDTLFGYSLRKRGIAIKHIDNALLHSGLEPNDVYLTKVEVSMKTLVEIRNEIDETPLLSCVRKIESLHLASLAASTWKLCRGALKCNLLSKHPSTTLLNIYKLGCFCYLNRKKLDVV